MKAVKTDIDGVYILEPVVFGDARGYFFESYSQKDFPAEIGDIRFVQDNESKSGYGVVRGLHFQKGAFAQAKLVRVVRGCVPGLLFFPLPCLEAERHLSASIL